MKLLKKLMVWSLVLVLAGGNLYQGWDVICIHALEFFGHPKDAPVDPDSAAAMRSALQGMEARISKFQQESSAREEAREKQVRAMREELALYKSFADDSRAEVEKMQEKVEGANKNSGNVSQALRQVVTELIKAKALPEYFSTVF